MPHTTLQTTEDIISDILNWVCPECGGPMGGRTKEFKCQGECRTDWRDVWERSLRATTPQHLPPVNSRTAVRFKMTPGSRRDLLPS